MRLFAAISATFFLCCGISSAQTGAAVFGDVVRYAEVDSTLLGVEILHSLPSSLSVSQSSSIAKAFNDQISRNETRQFYGFRVRIYFDNSQNSREKSEMAERTCRSSFPEYSCYRTFSNPYFVVTMGDFRTRMEAEATLKNVRILFPEASVVKEKFRYPSLYGGRMYRSYHQNF